MTRTGILRAAAAVTAALILFSCNSAFAMGKLSAQSAALVEAGSTKLLFSQNAHVKLPMASTTKIMTALVVLERCNVDEKVKTPDEAYGTEGSSIYLKKGEAMTVRDLLYGLMLSSGNDAAVTLAIHAGGSVEGFAKLMNAKASELGCANTSFVTPNGLHDDNHYTTAYDMCLIAAEAMKHEAFRTIVSTQYKRAESGEIGRTFMNKNKILWRYEGGCGVKTGYTKAAGRCLVFAAERDGMLLVGTVLNAPSMFEDAAEVLDFGFQNYELVRIASAGDVIARTHVKNAKNKMLELVTNRDIIIPVKKGESTLVESKVSINGGENTDGENKDNTLPTAPVREGEALGSVALYEGTRFLYEIPLLAKNDVEPVDFPYILKWLTVRWTA